MCFQHRQLDEKNDESFRSTVKGADRMVEVYEKPHSEIEES